MTKNTQEQTSLKPYPVWVCSDCGKKASKKGQMEFSTWHIGDCGVCGEGGKYVTEPRDFFYPWFKGHKKIDNLTSLKQILEI